MNGFVGTPTLPVRFTLLSVAGDDHPFAPRLRRLPLGAAQACSAGPYRGADRQTVLRVAGHCDGAGDTECEALRSSRLPPSRASRSCSWPQSRPAPRNTLCAPSFSRVPSRSSPLKTRKDGRLKEKRGEEKKMALSLLSLSAPPCRFPLHSVGHLSLPVRYTHIHTLHTRTAARASNRQGRKTHRRHNHRIKSRSGKRRGTPRLGACTRQPAAGARFLLSASEASPACHGCRATREKREKKKHQACIREMRHSKRARLRYPR